MPCDRSSRSCSAASVRPGRDHSALASRQALGRVQREAREVPDRSHPAVAHGCLDRVRRILDHQQRVLARDRAQRVHVARPAREVHRQHRPRARPDQRPHRVRVDVQRVRVHVGEHGRRPCVQHRVRRRRPGERGRDHLIALAQPRRHHRQVQRRRARRGRDRVARSQPRRKPLLQLPRPRPAGQPARPQRLDHRRDLLVTQHRRRERQHAVAHGRAAVDGQGCGYGAAHATSNRTASTAVRARWSASCRVVPCAITYPARSVAVRRGPYRCPAA